MPRRRLDLTQQQIIAICRAATKDGYVPELRFGDVVVKMLPEAKIEKSLSAPDDQVEIADGVGGSKPWTGPHLNYREDRVLEWLSSRQRGFYSASGIPLAGRSTVGKLRALRFVTVEGNPDVITRDQSIAVSEAGLDFLRRRDLHRQRYPTL